VPIAVPGQCLTHFTATTQTEGKRHHRGTRAFARARRSRLRRRGGSAFLLVVGSTKPLVRGRSGRCVAASSVLANSAQGLVVRRLGRTVDIAPGGRRFEFAHVYLRVKAWNILWNKTLANCGERVMQRTSKVVPPPGRRQAAISGQRSSALDKLGGHWFEPSTAS
jgi:hypothetical protein